MGLFAWNLSLALDEDMPQDIDLTFAATYTAARRGSLAERRSESIRPVRALSPPCIYSCPTARSRCATLQNSPIMASWKAPSAPTCRTARILVPWSSLKDAATVRELSVSKGPTNRTSFLAESYENDIMRGVASDLFTKDELDKKYRRGRCLAMGRFEISQGTEDSLAIDDGRQFSMRQGRGTAKRSSFAQPALQARELVPNN